MSNRLAGPACAVLLSAGIAAAQPFLESDLQSQRLDQVSRVDAYGNARPFYREFRDVGSYANEVQREALMGYQVRSRRDLRRGGVQPFALPGDPVRGLANPASRPLPFEQPSATLSPRRLRAMSLYGGFTDRSTAAPPGAGSAILRKHGLITANAFTAPVWRANLRPQTRGPARQGPAEPPLPFDIVTTADSDEPVTTLGQMLEARSQRSAESLRDSAWQNMRRGNFRRAARGFEIVHSLDSSDGLSKLGEVLAYLSSGARRTAQVTVQQLARRVDNPFLLGLDLADVYGERQRDQLRAMVQWARAVETESEHALAIRAIVLWYLGERDEARRAAKELAEDFPESLYAHWSQRMDDATQSLSSISRDSG